MDRITDRDLSSRVDSVNHLLGFENVHYPTVGTVVLYQAYGSTAVHFVMNDQGGQRTLHGLGTKREAFYFLNGMLNGLRIAAESAKVQS